MVPALFAERLTVLSLNSVLGNLHDIDRSKHHSVDAMSRDDLKELNKDKILEEACREVSSEELWQGAKKTNFYPDLTTDSTSSQRRFGASCSIFSSTVSLKISKAFSCDRFAWNGNRDGPRSSA
ncbi:MAG: hypothetical protein Q9161_000568 [Pseudevernia consocians]